MIIEKFWSLGTHLGYLGPGSQKGLDIMFSKLCFPIAIGPNESPDMLVPFPHAENLKKFPDRRGERNGCRSFISYILPITYVTNSDFEFLTWQQWGMNP